jgi:opacity protein-like surface antigen
MKKVFRLLGIITLIFCFSGLLSAQIQRPANKPFKIEVGINFGSTLGYSITESAYDYGSLESYWFDIDAEYGEITPELSKPLSFGGNVSLITNMGIGVQFALDYNMNSDMTGTSTYNVSGFDLYYWEDISIADSWDVTGSADMMVLSLNFIYKYQGGMFCPWIAAGASYYNGSIEGSSKVGFGFEDAWMDADYVSPSVEMQQDLSGIGFNVGGGFDIHFTPNIAFSIEARYFILGESEINWETVAGEELQSYIYDLTYRMNSDWFQVKYGGYYYNNPKVYSWDYWQFGADDLDALMDSFKFNPSFPKIAAGFKFSF